MPDTPKVLFIRSDELDSSVLEGILREHVMLHRAADLLELKSHLEAGSYDVVFCGWSNPSGTWIDALEHVLQRYPDLPVVIFSRTAGEREWVEVLEAGAFDLLAAPYQKAEVLAVLEQAVASYAARRLYNLAPKVLALAS